MVLLDIIIVDKLETFLFWFINFRIVVMFNALDTKLLF